MAMEEHDLLIVADATYSMSTYLKSLNISLPQILRISSLTGCFSRIGLLAYRDYSDADLLEWSGWLHQGRPSDVLPHAQPDLTEMAKNLRADGGGDYPEAVKTALAKAYEVMRPEAQTLILLYTDATPHANCMESQRSSNNNKEKINLDRQVLKSYGGYGPLFVDWVSAANTFASGEKRAQVFAVLSGTMGLEGSAYYNYLTEVTRGFCVSLDDTSPEVISTVTIQLLLTWMGIERAHAPDQEDEKETLKESLTSISRYVSTVGIESLEHESSTRVEQFFPNANKERALVNKANISSMTLTTSVLKKYMPKKPHPLQDFSRRWFDDSAYKDLAFKQLLDIIKEDLSAMSLNPVFGKLWRTVCSDRTNDKRDALVDAFSQQLEDIRYSSAYPKMRKWLDESYDYTADILASIEAVRADEQYPCVFLDPSIKFTQSGSDAYQDADDIGLDRDDLLEIGRSCNTKILQRLGRILTRLTFVNSADELPERIANTSLKQLPRLPIALTQKKYARQFWRILLHLVIPGTLLSSRAGALVAALCLRMGLVPLMEAAVEEMIRFKDNWNDSSTTETWASSCLSLLLDADQNYRVHQQNNPGPDGTQIRELLHPHDKELFSRLVAFHMMKYNMEAALTACIPWTPNKSAAPVGPTVTCSGCQYARSVTMMGEGRKCGLCLVTEWDSPDKKEASIHANVSRDINSDYKAAWVQCCVASCRGQYVIYNVDDLKLRAKCHYCRTNSKAPLIECTECQNRMIWPEAYRNGLVKESEFTCPPCNSGRPPDAEVEVTAKQLAAENPLHTWLVCTSQGEDATYLWQRTIFSLISEIGPQELVSRIILFPDRHGPLVYKGKLIRNTEQLIETLRDKVDSRKTARRECSLCFSTFGSNSLSPACGRRGCLQKVCAGCLSSWYRLNTPGCIINMAALRCPFCRRFPTSRTLSKHGMGIHTVRNLANAIRDQETMIYAWCRDCGTAKEWMERNCAGGGPLYLKNWGCGDCITQRHGIKPCPGCGVMTEKISGCGHLTCPTPSCGMHWCYYCGKGFNVDEIYNHISQAHGGLFVDAYEGDDHDDEDVIY